MRESYELARLRAADALAEMLLFNLVDKQGAPIIDHVRSVYRMCRSLSVEQQLAALLHEVLEDAREKITPRSIAQMFGPDVARIVVSLSRLENEPYQDYICRVAEDPDAVPVKLADLNHNLDESRGAVPDGLRKRYTAARDKLERDYLRSARKATP